MYTIDHLVVEFTERFNTYYMAALNTDFSSLSLPAQVDYVRYLFEVLQHTLSHSCIVYRNFLQHCMVPATLLLEVHTLNIHTLEIYKYIQWNLSNLDTIGTDLIERCPQFRGC